MAYTYDAHSWSTKEAITKSKMNHIEDGIMYTADQANANETAINNLQTASSAEDVALWNALGYSKEILKNTTIQQAIQNLQDQIGDSNMKADLAALKTEVENAREQGYADLRATLQHIRDNVNSVTTIANRADGTASALETAINNARGTYSTLKERIDAIVSANDEAHRGFSTDITTIANTLSAPVEGKQFSAVQLLTEIVNAHRTDQDNLDARFDDIDTTLGTITGNGNTTIATKLNNVITEVEAARVSAANNISYIDLDARLEADEGKINNIQSEVNAAHRAAVTNDTLDNRFDDIESELTSAKDAIDARFDTVEATANAAAVASTVNVALDTINTHLDTLGTKDTQLENSINSVKNDVDAIEASIGEGFDRENTVAAAIATKANSSNMNIALADKVSTETMNTALAAKADTTTVNAISTTIVKEKADVAYTENVPSNTQTWTINDKDDYLLQAEDDKYYYWKHINNEWHLMGGAGSNSESGEGGGTGNSNAEDYETFDAFTEEEPEENKDYYVLQEDGIRHHYRYLHSLDENEEDIWTRIEIGQVIDTSKIKRYNMEKVYDEDEKKYYLKVYQYDYSENDNNIDGDLTDILPWKPSTAYTVDAQVVYSDGYAYKCIVDNSDAEWTPGNWEKISNICTIQFIELPEGGGGVSAGIVKRLTRIGDQAIETITNSQVLLEAFYAYHTTELDENGALIPVESSAGTYTLRTGNTVIETGTVPSGAYKATDIQPDDPGYMRFDVTNYCNVGTTSFELVVTTEGTQQTKNWTVKVIDLHLETTEPDVLLINHEDSYDFSYTAFGALSKTLYVVIDDDTEHTLTAPLPATSSGRTTSITIPAQEHGAHKIEMYLKATVGGISQQTPSIVREYIWYDPSSSTTILASPMNNETITAQQYSTIEIPYQVYQKDADSIVLEYYVDDSETPFDTITLNDTNTGILSYLATEKDAHTITIKVRGADGISIVVNLNITELDINVSPIGGAIIDFDPTMLTNSSNNRLPSWTVNGTTYKLTTSSNFNWSDDSSGGGYKTDSDGKCFVIKAGTYVDLDYPMFAGNGSNNILTNGAEMKIIFKTEAVRNIEAVWFQNVGTLTEKTIGIQLGAHYGWLKTDKAADTTSSADTSEYEAWVSGTTYNVDDIVLYKDTIYKCIVAVAADALETNPKDASAYWLSMGKVDTEILATNSYLYMPYSEEDKIELDININKYNANAGTNFIMSYEDGVPSKAYAYTYGDAGDGLYHSNTIRIGSDDCDVYIYRLRIYNKSLDTDDILQNFIADGVDINEKISRYNRNCIYWDETQGQYFTSPSATAVLDPIKLAEKIPDVKVLMLDTPAFTTGKKNFVQNSSLRCIHAEGGNVYTSRGDVDNWLFTNGFHSGQGTTSDNYGQSARNVDFLFEVDGVNYPTKKKNMGSYTPSKNYVSRVYIGKEASDFINDTWVPTREAEENEICDDWKGDNCKVALTETSVPNNYFNLKVNVASSENVNNALFQKRYDDFLTYNSPAQTAQIAKHRANYAALGLNPDDIKIKNSMEFVPAVLFVRENDSTQDSAGNYTKHNEFNDTNWHFYALGNIGDSKKTDYTRAYDPDDMNEFTCENSDNNTNNGQFQSGVFMYQGKRAIETPYEAFDEEKEYQVGAIVINNGVIQTYNGSAWQNVTLIGWEDSETPYFAPYTAPNTMQYLYPITSSEWNVKIYDENADTGVYSDKVVYANYKHHTLVSEEFDGDHSFEFRYACRGDYRDGDPINETAGQDNDAQFELNHGVMLAMYEWLLTATEEQYATEAPQWFVKSAMEFFYAYTHYYTMMDNRAKNTFWHFAKTGTYIEASRPVKELLHVYEESSDNGSTWQSATGTEIDTNKKYRTQYAFDLWAYDMDTAAGIDNNGAQVFPYGKEDGDYRVEGDASSGYAFNGAGSIFWRRLKNTFASEIVDVMRSTDSDCFNAEDLINEFDTFQNCYPEEIWRLDIERKYIRTFTGASIDKSITAGKQNPRFLTSMMQGRKKYQRRQWIRDQGVYFNSKYRLPDITDNSNTIEFNCTTPADIENIAVTPSYYLQLTPYQDMYLNVQVGNGNYKDSYVTADGSKNLRAKAGQTYTFNLSGNYQETRIYINGANHLSAIGNLAAMYPYSFDLRALAHIKTLDIGTDVSGYTNTKFTELKLPTYMPLLESLNIKNCHSVAGTIELDTANNIRTVEATGTAITGVSLPDYTNIETLYIPSTVTALSLYGARALTDFKVYNNIGTNDYSSLYKLHIYDSDYSASVDWISIASAILEKRSLQTELSLLRLSTATIGDISTLEPFSEFKTTLENAGGKLELSGVINVTGNWSIIERDNYGGLSTSIWPNLTFNTDNGTQQTKHKVTYKYDAYQDNDGNIIQTDEPIKILYINDGATAPDIYADGTLTEMPYRAATVRQTYEFGTLDPFNNDAYIPYSGWQLSGSTTSLYESGGAPIIRRDTVIETHFETSARTYYVKWYMHKDDATSLVKTSSAAVEYGQGYNLEAPTIAEIHEAGQDTCSISISNGSATYSIFQGWEKLPTNIAPSATDETYNIYASWDTNTVVIDDLFSTNNLSNLTPEQLLVLSALDSNAKNTYSISTKIVEGTRMTYTLGQDSIVEGTALINGNPVRYGTASNQNGTTTSIQPLKSGNDEFTIAIDYCFDPDVTYDSQYSFATLASVYYGPISTLGIRNGLGLFYGLEDGIPGPRVGWGDMYNNASQSVSVGNTTNPGQRNVVVLRHPAGSNSLYVYSGLTNSINTPTDVAVNTLTWQNNNSDAYLNFARLIGENESVDAQDGTPQIITNAKGTIFWAKYWNQDLGAGECKRLAAWPHESITFAISRLNNASTSMARVSNTSAIAPSIYLSALTGSMHSRVVQSRQQNLATFSGRDNSIARTICNNRVFAGLPTKLQSIMCKPTVAYTVVNYVNNEQTGASYEVSNSPALDKDYVFQYSAANVLSDGSSIYAQREDTYSKPFSWYNSANVAAYTYSAANGWTVNSGDTTAANYLNIRFPFKAIPWGSTNKLRVFRETIESITGSTQVAYTIAQMGEIRSGDIYIDISNNTYIYVLNNEIQTLGIQTMPTTGDYAKFNVTSLATASRGGWVRASDYWTRSVIASTNGANFAYVHPYGTTETSSVNNASTAGLNLMYTITI